MKRMSKLAILAFVTGLLPAVAWLIIRLYLWDMSSMSALWKERLAMTCMTLAFYSWIVPIVISVISAIRIHKSKGHLRGIAFTAVGGSLAIISAIAWITYWYLYQR